MELLKISMSDCELQVKWWTERVMETELSVNLMFAQSLSW